MHDLYSPNHIQIETSFGACTAKCSMCIIGKVTQPPKIMSNDQFYNLITKLTVIKTQQFLTLHGLGEPLLDRGLPEKVYMAKNLGYKSVGFASNCTELNESMAIKLLNAKLDVIICSIDGIKKETHENIRIGTSFTKVFDNVINFIKIRDLTDSKTRILIRFIRQESNKNEWDEYNSFWNSKLNKNLGDGVLRVDIHNWGGQINNDNDNDNLVKFADNKICQIVCDDLINRLVIRYNGLINLCCGDFIDLFDLGNAFNGDILKLYNSDIFMKFRNAMYNGLLYTLNPCSSCSLILKRMSRILPV
jgi:MoaA/NifB/PqqE/SkfB family radical SAM enzyme